MKTIATDTDAEGLGARMNELFASGFTDFHLEPGHGAGAIRITASDAEQNTREGWGKKVKTERRGFGPKGP